MFLILHLYSKLNYFYFYSQT